MDVAKTLAKASTADIFVQLIQNSLRRNEMTQRILKAELPDKVKVALIKSTDTAQGLDETISLLDRMDVEKDSGLLEQIIESINWNLIGRVAEDAAKREKPTEPKEPARSWVYFIKSKKSGLIKIGRSINPDKRFNAIRTMSPDELVLLGSIPEKVMTESELHKKFSHLRKHGEWFEGDDELWDFIDGLEFSAAAENN